jgi:epsin
MTTSTTSKLPLPPPQAQVSPSSATKTCCPPSTCSTNKTCYPASARSTISTSTAVQPIQQPNLFGPGMNVMSPGSRTTSPSYGAPNYNISTMSPTPPLMQQGNTLVSGSAKPTTSSPTPAKPATSANFDDLWNLSLGATSTANKPNTNPCSRQIDEGSGEGEGDCGDLGSYEPEPSRQPAMGGGLWGPSNTTATNANIAKPSGGIDDLLF